MLPSTKSNLCSILFLEQVKFQYSKYFFEIYWGCFRSSLERVPSNNYSGMSLFTIIIIHKKAKLSVRYPSYGKSSIKPATLSNKPPLFRGRKLITPPPPFPSLFFSNDRLCLSVMTWWGLIQDGLLTCELVWSSESKWDV